MVSSISSKKRTKSFFGWNRTIFVRFFEEIEDTKNHFECNWPLAWPQIWIANGPEVLKSARSINVGYCLLSNPFCFRGTNVYWPWCQSKVQLIMEFRIKCPAHVEVMPYPCSLFYLDVKFGKQIIFKREEDSLPSSHWIWYVTKLIS